MDAVLIGLGAIGLGYDIGKGSNIQTHSKALFNRGWNVHAIDPDESKREQAEKLYGFNTSTDLIVSEKLNQPELVIIASPTIHHLDHLKFGLSLDPKVVLIEKPLALDLFELEEIQNLVSKSNVIPMVNLVRNYDEQTIGFLSSVPNIEETEIDVFYSKGLVHNGIHFLALLRKVFGELSEGNVIDFDEDKAVISLRIGKTKTTFTPNSQKDPSNTVNIRTHGNTWKMENGGRELLKVTQNEVDYRAEGLLDQYQLGVLNKIESVLAGEPDDSFEIAVAAESFLYCLINEAR